MDKAELIGRLRDILDNDLDDVLQGDYSKRCEIMNAFEGVIDMIESYS